MTSNQIKYWDLQERTRNNKAVEKETNRSNLAREAETNRANLAKEKETNRSNRAREWENWNARMDLNRRFGIQQAEIERQNRINNDLAYKQLEELKRHNLSDEGIRLISASADYNRAAEQARNNRVLESQGQQKIVEQHYVNEANLGQNQQKIDEQRRYNLAEQELKAGTLEETQRSHLANEALDRFRNTLSENHMIEEVRHNLATESISREDNSIKRERNNIEVFKTTLHEANSLFQSMANNLFRTIPLVGGVK